MRSSRLLLALGTAITLRGGLMFAHDLERTQVTITVERDGSFVVDVTNDPTWFLLRLEPFAGRTVPPSISPAERDRRISELAAVFVDRVVLFVDQHEVRPESAEYVPSIGGFRLRGHLPSGAHAFRWFYGIVIDPYRLTVRFANGATNTQVIAGEAWSDPIALPASPRTTRIELAVMTAIALLFLSIRAWTTRRA